MAVVDVELPSGRYAIPTLGGFVLSEKEHSARAEIVSLFVNATLSLSADDWRDLVGLSPEEARKAPAVRGIHFEPRAMVSDHSVGSAPESPLALKILSFGADRQTLLVNGVVDDGRFRFREEGGFRPDLGSPLGQANVKLVMNEIETEYVATASPLKVLMTRSELSSLVARGAGEEAGPIAGVSRAVDLLDAVAQPGYDGPGRLTGRDHRGSDGVKALLASFGGCEFRGLVFDPRLARSFPDGLRILAELRVATEGRDVPAVRSSSRSLDVASGIER